MCGICGWIDNRPVNREILQRMILALRHRGPDAQQVELVEASVGLGHARLSIIDLSEQANQPMHNEDKSKWLVYNGEFYTFHPFREELIQKGHSFVSHTDSEVLLHLYEEHGPDFIKKLRGMFAFGIWDKTNRQLMIGRDRVGIKPLYYFHDGNTFLFASELKALLRHPAITRELDHEAVNYYFMLGYIPGEHCIFKKIKKLLPGHYLIFKDGVTSSHCYWSLPDSVNMNLKTEDEYTERLFELLSKSVKLRMISDVPLGVFLSGGVDSSIITALMASHSPEPIKTFSIGFNEDKFNELPYARQIAKHINSDHHEFTVSLDHTESLDEIINYFDEPFADDSAIPTFYVSKMAKEYVTVILSGDGGDELFGGYNWYEWVLRQNRFNRLPLTFRNSISHIAGFPSRKFKGQHFLRTLALNETETFIERTSVFYGDDLHKLLPDFFRENIPEAFRKYYTKHSGSIINRMTRTDFSCYLPEDILTKIDRASMAVSLEARVPLLDHKVCEFAFSLPEHLKINCHTKKYLLKKIAEQLLPKDFPLARKQGFSIPLADWMKGSLGDRLENALIDSSAVNFVSKDFVRALLTEHRSGKQNHAKKLYAILFFCLWEKKYA